MDFNTKQAWKEYLFQFISDSRKQKFEDVIAMRSRHITVVLEDIFQPQNASAVLRSCDLTGVQDVHIIENRNTYTLNPNVALGSSKWLNLHKYSEAENNTEEAFNALRAKGYKIVATTPHTKDVMLPDLDVSGKTALVFGTELEGLSDYAIENADAWVKIPMLGFTESFNISVSAAICLYSLSAKVRKSDVNWMLSDQEQLDILIRWACNTVKNPELHERNFLERMKK